MIRNDLEKALQEMNMSVTGECLQSFELFADELKKWNSKFNLTAICKDSDIAIKHIIDSLVFASFVNTKDRVLDIGSGAGVPAIPLKIIKPSVRVVSVDAVGKKIMFQRHIARLLGVGGFEAVHARVESLYSTDIGVFDIITSRAFSRLGTFVTLAAPLLRNGGRMIAMKGQDVRTEIECAADELRILGFEISSMHNYSLAMDKGERCLVMISSVKAHK